MDLEWRISGCKYSKIRFEGIKNVVTQNIEKRFHNRLLKDFTTDFKVNECYKTRCFGEQKNETDQN